jgi:calcineurin-like phosphoesterase family protein
MIDLIKEINLDTFIISDLHFAHSRILQFEPVRVEYLSDYNSDVMLECQELLTLLNLIPREQRYNHTEINTLCKFLLPFHDEMIIEKWNMTVGDEDLILCLGDFAFSDVKKYTELLNGRKILLMGNHDRNSVSEYYDSGWNYVISTVHENIALDEDITIPEIIQTDKHCSGLFKTIEQHKILFSHYPIFNTSLYDNKFSKITEILESMYSNNNATINIHGHTHSSKSTFPNAISASIEYCASLSPITIRALMEKNQ